MKSKSMKIAALLLVLTLITSCFLGSTFAKYTSSTDGTATARVAYWGFTSTSLTLDNLFSTTYDSEHVKSSGEDLVVAPGTTGETKFAFAYANGSKTPEVAYTFTVSATGSCDAELAKELVWYLDGTMCGANGTFEELLAAINALAGDSAGTKDYAAGTLPDAFHDASTEHTIKWEWAFSETGGDPADTALGNAAASPGVTLTISICATQID